MVTVQGSDHSDGSDGVSSNRLLEEWANAQSTEMNFDSLARPRPCCE